MRRAAALALLSLAACGPRYTVVSGPSRPLAEFGALEVKDVELLDPKVPKDVRDLAGWLTRNLRARVTPLVRGSGPKLVLAAKLDPRGLREVGGLIHTRWGGAATLDATFTTEKGEFVAQVVSTADASPNGQLSPAGDRLVDDVASFVASRP